MTGSSFDHHFPSLSSQGFVSSTNRFVAIAFALLALTFSLSRAQEVASSSPTLKPVPNTSHSNNAPSKASDKATNPTSVHVDVEVNAGKAAPVDLSATSFHASAKDIMSSAGTYGDFSRYLQLYPGVAFNSDQSDDVLVRGGNPIENLYLVDGIAVPNINVFAVEGTTGGLVSMIDTAAVDGLDFLTGGYDARYDERLSSVVDIHTKGSGRSYTEADLGYIGAGLTAEYRLPKGGYGLLSAHRSLFNLFMDNIGLNGVPIYTNLLASEHLKPNNKDTVSILTIGGIDSIKIKPECNDVAETSTINMQYDGWRGTNGIVWQRLFSPTSFGTATLSDSESEQDIEQQDQLLNGQFSIVGTSPFSIPPDDWPTVPVYSELTHDGVTDFKYDYQATPFRKTGLLAGSDVRIHRVAYNVSQPQGQQSPLTPDPTRSDASSFFPHFWIGETGSYVQGNYQVSKRWQMSGGVRLQTFAFGAETTVTPRLSSLVHLTSHIDAHASFGQYAQLPPYIYLTAFQQNWELKPIHNTHLVGGFSFTSGRLGTISLEGYRKDYRDYPVSTEYPTLSLANMVDTLGQELVWLPMTSAGHGLAEGVELSFELRFGSHLYLMGNGSKAHNDFSGLDGVMRPGNFDYPRIANIAGVYRSGRKYEASYRYEYSSGRPYTPFQLTETVEQNRPIYDMSQVNALRGPVYSRLDFAVNRNFYFGNDHVFTVYLGLVNAWNRQNFLGYEWTPRVNILWPCTSDPNHCVTEATQLGRLPNVGMRYFF